jgi:hypothetical protein
MPRRASQNYLPIRCSLGIETNYNSLVMLWKQIESSTCSVLISSMTNLSLLMAAIEIPCADLRDALAIMPETSGICQCAIKQLALFRFQRPTDNRLMTPVYLAAGSGNTAGLFFPSLPTALMPNCKLSFGRSTVTLLVLPTSSAWLHCNAPATLHTSS